MQVQLEMDQGPAIALVTDIDGDNVTLDLNHPLAGMNLNFDVEIIEVREATEEELNHGHVHGPGGHQH
jgi:FKBP-type peptidyl-prolyl cis-trans isomerase SlyD